MNPTFNAAKIENVYARRGYLIVVLPLVIMLYGVLMVYVLTKDMVMSIWDVITYRLPNDARGLCEAYQYAWKGPNKQ